MTREAAVTTSAALAPSRGQTQPAPSASSRTAYHTIAIGNINVFYREAGPRGAQTFLLLHGYRRDVPDAEVHVLDAGHFALDEKVDELAAHIRSFLGKQ
jgi:hypothetical protein